MPSKKKSEQDELLEEAEAEVDADGDEDGELGDLSQYETKTIGAVDPGEYLSEIVEVKKTKVKSGENAGQPQLRIRLALIEPKAGKPIFKHCGLTGKSAPFTKGFLKQFGVDVNAPLTIADIKGRKAYVTLSIREQDGRAPDNEIVGYRPYTTDEFGVPDAEELPE